MLKGSWMTTGAGIGAILTALGSLLSGIAHNDVGAIGNAITGIIAGIGLLLARDNNKSSEDVGIK